MVLNLFGSRTSFSTTIFIDPMTHFFSCLWFSQYFYPIKYLIAWHNKNNAYLLYIFSVWKCYTDHLRLKINEWMLNNIKNTSCICLNLISCCLRSLRCNQNESESKKGFLLVLTGGPDGRISNMETHPAIAGTQRMVRRHVCVFVHIWSIKALKALFCFKMLHCPVGLT